MKKLMLLAMLSLIVKAGYAQKVSAGKVPADVIASFQKLYPGAKEVEWEKEGNNYEAEFEVQKTDHTAIFDPSGKIIESEVEISVAQLPLVARDYITIFYPKQKVKEAALITDDKGIRSYEAEIKGMDLIFEENGNFIREVKK